MAHYLKKEDEFANYIVCDGPPPQRKLHLSSSDVKE